MEGSGKGILITVVKWSPTNNPSFCFPFSTSAHGVAKDRVYKVGTNAFGKSYIGVLKGAYVRYTIANAGDGNKVGVDDIIIGAVPNSSPNGTHFASTAYVAYRMSNGLPTDLCTINLSSLSTVEGFPMHGLKESDFCVSSVSGVGA